MKNFIIRTITAVFYVLIIVTCFFKLNMMALVFGGFVMVATIREFAGLINDNVEDVRINTFISAAAGVFLFLAVLGFCSNLTPPVVFVPYLITIIYLFVAELFLKAKNPIANWAYTMLPQMYIALPLSMIPVLAFHVDAAGSVIFTPALPLSVFIFLWCNDTGAYLVGSLLGRHKLFPRVSPGKSWEGSVGGAVFVLVVAAAVGHVIEHGLFADLVPVMGQPLGMTAWQWMGLGLIVVVFGTLGDLIESLFKRTLGIKDSGSILPGHGGMLDRFDSALLAFPAAVVYIYTVTML